MTKNTASGELVVILITCQAAQLINSVNL